MKTILQTGDPTLRRIAKPISKSEILSPRIKKLIVEMKKLLAKEELGVALAAPQVGESLRLFLVAGKALAERNKKGEIVGESPDLVFINPEVLRVSRTKKEMHEGCLSLRGKWGIVPRAQKMSVRACDEQGNLFTHNATGLLAHIFQHEMDHLEGVLYTDKAKFVYDEKDEIKR